MRSCRRCQRAIVPARASSPAPTARWSRARRRCRFSCRGLGQLSDSYFLFYSFFFPLKLGWPYGDKRGETKNTIKILFRLLSEPREIRFVIDSIILSVCDFLLRDLFDDRGKLYELLNFSNNSLPDASTNTATHTKRKTPCYWSSAATSKCSSGMICSTTAKVAKCVGFVHMLFPL